MTIIPWLYASLKWVIIGSGNGLSPVRHQTIALINADLLSIRPLETDASEILIETQKFSFNKNAFGCHRQITSICRLQNCGGVAHPLFSFWIGISTLISLVTSHERHTFSIQRQVDCLFNSFFSQRKHYSLHHLPFVRGIQWWPAFSCLTLCV